MKKNILFLLKSYEMGGLEVVTSVLANKFVDEGHLVSIFAFESAKSVSIEDRLDKRIHTYTLGYQGYSEECVYYAGRDGRGADSNSYQPMGATYLSFKNCR